MMTKEKTCDTCRYENRSIYKEPCSSCSLLYRSVRWREKEEPCNGCGMPPEQMFCGDRTCDTCKYKDLDIKDDPCYICYYGGGDVFDVPLWACSNDPFAPLTDDEL